QRGGAVAGIHDFAADALQKRTNRARVLVVGGASALDEAQEVEHDHRAAGILGQEAFEIGTTRIDCHQSSLTFETSILGRGIFGAISASVLTMVRATTRLRYHL